MALIDGFSIAPENEELFFKAIRWGNRFVNTRLISKERPLSREAKNDVINTSVLPQVSEIWNGLTEEEKTLWVNAAYWAGQTGYNLFVQDTSYRINNGIAGIAVPNEYHQYKVVRVDITQGNKSYTVSQVHNKQYYKLTKVTGTQNQYKPVLITENVTMPMYFRFNLKSNLTKAATVSAFEARVEIDFIGPDGYDQTAYTFNVPINTAWDYFEIPVEGFEYEVLTYAIIFRVQGYTGVFEYDGIEIEHSSQNWAFDSNCDTVGYKQKNYGVYIPLAWYEVNFYKGIEVVSVYPSE
jgi:hypothetical protein